MPPLFLKKWVGYAVLMLLGLLLAGGVLIWLAGTEPALRWSARKAEQMSHGQLVLGAVHGSLYGPLRIESLSYQSGGQRFEITEANLDWSPGSLLLRHIQINRLTVQELKIIEINPAAQPAKFPESLRLPVTVSAPAITVDRIVFMRAGTTYIMSDLDLSLEKSSDSYQLELRNIASKWGKGEAQVVLGDMQPFRISAHATMQQTEGLSYRAEADASGSLTQLLVHAQASAEDGRAELHATLTPFDKIPISQARITANGINPVRFRKDLPEANLSLVFSLALNEADGWQGNFMLHNMLAGPWDKSRLPVAEISARFDGALDRLDLSAINLDLATAGTFTGDGKVMNQQLQLKLNTTNFNPQGVLSKMRPMRLAGGMRLRGGEESQELSADLHDQSYMLHLDAHHQDAMIVLRQATLQSGSGNLTLHGALSLDGLQPFNLAGTLQKFNPAEFGNYPTARINASFSGAGSLAEDPHATLEFSIANSLFRQQPLSGNGKLSISATRIWDSDVTLRLARNHAEIKGGLGNPGDSLAFRIEAGNLAELDPELGGQLHATGSLGGNFSAPSISFDTQASALSWRKLYRLASLKASGQLGQGRDGSLALDATLQGLAAPQLQLDQASLTVQGTRTRHTLQFTAKNADFDMESRLAGGWHEQSGWSGLVLELVNRGRHAFALKSPAKLEVAMHHFLLGNADFDFENASLAVHEINYQDEQIVSSGAFKGLSLAYLQSVSEQAAALKTDLTLNGEWKFSVRDKINGHIALWREHGDVSLPTEPPTTLGLDHLTLNVDALNNHVHGQLQASGSKLGSLKADAQTVLSRRNGVWGIAGNAPVSADADLSLKSMAWIVPLLDKTGALILDGTLKAAVHADGTLAQPKLSGTLSGDHFSVALPNLGLSFTEGSFQAKLQDQVLNLDNLAVRGGNGRLSGQGRLALEGDSPVMQLSLKADKLEVLSRPDRLLILSGTGDISALGKKVRVAAKLKADQGLIELPKDDQPAASIDVIVVDQANTPENKNLPYAISFDLDLDLGEHFFVKGRGLNAQFGGALKLTSESGAMPSSLGTLRVIKGTYSAYGQALAIERGIFNFQGPIDNPGLDIIALRKNQPVEAGVAVTGTVQSPRVKLVSNPSVPDKEKLSWLVLGHGIEDASGQEYDSLQTAAGVLLTIGESITLQQNIAHAAGLEEFSLKGSGKLEGTVLAMGKRLSSRAYLSYEKGLSGTSNLVKINYTLTKRLSVQAQAGTVPAMDLFYTFRFD